MQPHAQYRFLHKGEILFREGDAGDCAYLIEAGKIRIRVQRAGLPVEIATLGRGEIFGEMSILSRGARSATAIADVDCKLQRIEPEQFLQRIKALDPVMRLSIETLLTRLRSTLKQVKPGLDVVSPVEQHAIPFDPRAIEELQLESDLAVGIRENQLRVNFQPIVELASGEIAGFEALVRWNHPENGFMSPDLFIPIAEKSHLICNITRSCIENSLDALSQLKRARSRRDSPVPFISVNITARDLECPDFIEWIEGVISRRGVLPESLKLEITESSLIANLDAAGDVIRDLRSLGVGVAIDDFGTGYSSFSHLARLPISILKIDRSFVGGMEGCETSRKIIKMIVMLAGELNIPVVAEGVERIEDARTLRHLKCDHGQGYYYSRPLTIEQAAAVLGTWDPNICASIVQPKDDWSLTADVA